MIDYAEVERRLAAIAAAQLPGRGPQVTDARPDGDVARFARARARWTMARAWNAYAAPRTNPFRRHEIDAAPLETAIAVIEAAQAFNEGYLLLHATRVVPGGTRTPDEDDLAWYAAVRDRLLATAEEARAYLALVDAVARSVGGDDTRVAACAFARWATQAIRDSLPADA